MDILSGELELELEFGDFGNSSMEMPVDFETVSHARAYMGAGIPPGWSADLVREGYLPDDADLTATGIGMVDAHLAEGSV
ncbi:MAG: hypothetical protein LBR80_08635 [Deltaproteobacteria bacterium]|nr:hypothetical protein [Deltaproteobacteria bacterium]